MALSINFNRQVLVALNPKTCEKTTIHIASNQDENLSSLLGKYIHSKSSNPYNLIGIAEDIDLGNKFALYTMLYDPYKSFRCEDVSRDTIFIRGLYDNFLKK